MSQAELDSRFFQMWVPSPTRTFRKERIWRKVSVRRLVLSVEDDTAAYALIRHAFREIGSELELERTVDGRDALDFLNRSGPIPGCTQTQLDPARHQPTPNERPGIACRDANERVVAGYPGRDLLVLKACTPIAPSVWRSVPASLLSSRLAMTSF